MNILMKNSIVWLFAHSLIAEKVNLVPSDAFVMKTDLQLQLADQLVPFIHSKQMSCLANGSRCVRPSGKHFDEKIELLSWSGICQEFWKHLSYWRKHFWKSISGRKNISRQLTFFSSLCSVLARQWNLPSMKDLNI